MEIFLISVTYKSGVDTDFYYVGRENALKAFENISHEPDVYVMALFDCGINVSGLVTVKKMLKRI